MCIVSVYSDSSSLVNSVHLNKQHDPINNLLAGITINNCCFHEYNATRT